MKHKRLIFFSVVLVASISVWLACGYFFFQSVLYDEDSYKTELLQIKDVTLTHVIESQREDILSKRVDLYLRGLPNTTHIESVYTMDYIPKGFEYIPFNWQFTISDTEHEEWILGKRKYLVVKDTRTTLGLYLREDTRLTLNYQIHSKNSSVQQHIYFTAVETKDLQHFLNNDPSIEPLFEHELDLISQQPIHSVLKWESLLTSPMTSFLFYYDDSADQSIGLNSAHFNFTFFVPTVSLPHTYNRKYDHVNANTKIDQHKFTMLVYRGVDRLITEDQSASTSIFTLSYSEVRPASLLGIILSPIIFGSTFILDIILFLILYLTSTLSPQQRTVEENKSLLA